MAEALVEGHARFRCHEGLAAYLAGTDRLAELPHVGTAADLLAASLAFELGAIREDDGGEVDAGGAHQLGEGVVVVPAEEHRAVDGVCP